MAGLDPVGNIETVRGSLDGERAEDVLSFWEEHGALEREQGRERLPEVVCVLADESGGVAGVNSAYRSEVAAIGNRSFWVYRSFLAPEASGAWDRMLNAAFDALHSEADAGEQPPLGLCVPLEADEASRSPAVVWPQTKLMLAGHLRDGGQLRIRYFEDAEIGPGVPGSPSSSQMGDAEYPLEDRYRIAPLAEAEEVSADDVIAFWEREQAIARDEALRRVHEVLLVATEHDRAVVGVSSAYLQRSAQLKLDLWHQRAFVSRDHRHSSVAAHLALGGRDLLERRFRSGEDTRGAGIAWEVENEELKRYFNRAHWVLTDFMFIGENARGDHVRVHFFEGAEVPDRA